MEDDGAERDDLEDDEAGAQLRVVKRCLRKSLAMEPEQKDIVIEKIEGLVRTVSRLMHHGSLLATDYVLHLLAEGRPPTDDLLKNQTFYRQCFMYSSTETRVGALPEIKEFADARRGIIPDTPLVSFAGNCSNAAARKMKASVLTMLSYRFKQRIAAAVAAAFPDLPSRTRDAIRRRCIGISGGVPSVLQREAWGFIDAIRGEVFGGADTSAAAVRQVVTCSRAIKKADREEVCGALLEGRMPRDEVLKNKGRELAGHILAFLPACRDPSTLSDEGALRSLVLSRVPPRASEDDRRNVIEDVMDGSSSADGKYSTLVAAARGMLRFSGVITVLWLKQNPSKALLAIHRMMREVEEGIVRAEKKGRERYPRRFPLLPLFGQRRQMVTIDGDTLVSICKEAKLLKGGAKRSSLSDEFRHSLFRVPENFVFSEKTSLESDGVAIIMRASKEVVRMAPREATADDMEGVEYDRVVANDPGRASIATTVEWSRGGGLKPGSVRLTRDEYYSHAGIDRRAKKRRKRDAGIAEELGVLRTVSLKVSDPTEFEEALRVRMGVVEALWAHKLARWTSMMDMAGYVGRRRALDRFWRRKVGLERNPEESRTVVVFGDGRFAASGRRERAVPRKATEAAAARFAKAVVKVGEQYTTIVCSGCHHPTEAVRLRRWKRGRDGMPVQRLVDVRELRRCVSNACRHCRASPYKSRDVDAAISILQVFLAGRRRPPCYTKEGYKALRPAM